MVVANLSRDGTRRRDRSRLRTCIATGLLVSLASCLLVASALGASGGTGGNDSTQGTSSTTARRSAVQSIPFDKLDADSREKVSSVVNSAGIYRRLPTRTVNCDPDMYLFLVRHPDVVVNVWEVLGISQIQLRQTDIDSFSVSETEGTAASLEFLYHSRDLQVIYGKWTYTGPVLSHKVSGNCVAVLKSSYAKDAAGKYFITARLDGFVSVDSGGADMLARALQPLMVKNVDNNFIQTIAFLGSLSRTAEVNPHGMQRLADRLTHVQPQTRDQLGEVVASVAQRAAATTEGASSRVASRPQNGDSK